MNQTTDVATQPEDVLEPGGDGAPRNTVVFRCSRSWEELSTTEHALVRYCTDCARHVFQVHDIDGLRRVIAAGQCGYCLDPKLGRFLGGAPAELSLRSSLNWD